MKDKTYFNLANLFSSTKRINEVKPRTINLTMQSKYCLIGIFIKSVLVFLSN